MRLQAHKARGEQRDLVPHEAQAKAGVLALDLLRRRRLGCRGLAADDVRNAGDLVNLRLDLVVGLVGVDQGLGEHVERDDVDAAL